MMKNSRLLLIVAAAALVVMVAPVFAAGEGKLKNAVAAPALSVSEWVKGEPVKLEDGKGKSIYVVEFWATWCPPCRDSIPHLTELQKTYRDKGVVVIGVSAEDPKTVESFVQKLGDKMDYTVAVDAGKATHKAFSKIVPIPGIPTAFVIDKEGQVVWSGHPMLGLDDFLKEMTSGEGADEPASQEAGEAA